MKGEERGTLDGGKYLRRPETFLEVVYALVSLQMQLAQSRYEAKNLTL